MATLTSEALRALELWRNRSQGRLVALFSRVQTARNNAQLRTTANPSLIEKVGRTTQALNSMSTIVRLMREAPDSTASLQSFLNYGARYIIHVNDLVRSVTVNHDGHAQWTNPSFQRVAITALRAVRLILLSVRRGWVSWRLLFHLIGSLAQRFGDLFICLCVFFQQEQVNLVAQQSDSVMLLPSTKALLGHATQWFLAKLAQGSALPIIRRQRNILFLHARVLALQVALETTTHVFPPQLASLLPLDAVSAFNLSPLDYACVSCPVHVLPKSNCKSREQRNKHQHEPLRNARCDVFNFEALRCNGVTPLRIRFASGARSVSAIQETSFPGGKKIFDLLTQDACALASFEHAICRLLTDLGYGCNLGSLLSSSAANVLHKDWEDSSSFPTLKFRDEILRKQKLVVPYQPTIPFNTIIKLVCLFAYFSAPNLRRWPVLIHCALAALTYHHGFSFMEIETKPTRYVKTVRALMGLSRSTALATLPLLSRLREHVAARGALPRHEEDLLLQAAVNGFAIRNVIDGEFFRFVADVVAPAVLRRLEQSHDVDHRRAIINRILSDRVRPEEGWKGVRSLFDEVVTRFDCRRCKEAQPTSMHDSHAAHVVCLLLDPLRTKDLGELSTSGDHVE